MKPTTPGKRGQITTREELIYALCRAAEVEHGLICIYLFAAFSVKSFLEEGIDEVQRDQIRNWEGVVLLVARQEMEHLGIVCNLLNAIGAPQHFDRPNFPQSPKYYETEGAFTLQRFSLETMARFMEFEKPAATSSATGVVEGDELVPDPIKIFQHHTVQELYQAILTGFENLDADPNVKLFIGPPEAQIQDDQIVVGYGNKEYGITMVKVTDLPSAAQAIHLIIEQGEGIDLDVPSTKPGGPELQKLYGRITREVGRLKRLQFGPQDWRKAGEELIGIAGHLLEVIEQVRRVIIDDAALVKMLDVATHDLKELELQASEILKQSEPAHPAAELHRIRGEMVRATTRDVEGLVLSGFLPECHYLMFWQIYEALKHIDYQPARNVVSNPALRHHEDNAGKPLHIITHPYSRKMLELFNASYETMVQMLIITFSYNNISNSDRTLLVNTAFFPFMTMVIRPLSEILTQLPAFTEEPAGHDFKWQCAGPSFEYYIDTAFLPNRQAGWNYLEERLVQMAEFSKELTDKPDGLDRYLPEPMLKNLLKQVDFVHQNLKRIAENFKIGIAS